MFGELSEFLRRNLWPGADGALPTIEETDFYGSLTNHPSHRHHSHLPNRRPPNRRCSSGRCSNRHCSNRRSNSMAAEAEAEPRLDSSSRSRRPSHLPNRHLPNPRPPNRRPPNRGRGRRNPRHSPIAIA
jgi:hypothetical protein